MCYFDNFAASVRTDFRMWPHRYHRLAPSSFGMALGTHTWPPPCDLYYNPDWVNILDWYMDCPL